MTNYIYAIYDHLIDKEWIVGKNGWRDTDSGLFWKYNPEFTPAAFIQPYVIKDNV